MDDQEFQAMDEQEFQDLINDIDLAGVDQAAICHQIDIDQPRQKLNLEQMKALHEHFHNCLWNGSALHLSIEAELSGAGLLAQSVTVT